MESFDKALLNLFSLYNTVGLHPSLGKQISGTFLSYVKGINSVWPNTFYLNPNFSRDASNLFEGIPLEQFSKLNPLLITKTEVQLQNKLRRQAFMPKEQWKGMLRQIGSNEDFEIKSESLEVSTVQTGTELKEWLDVVSSNLFAEKVLSYELFQYFLDSCAELICLRLAGSMIGASMIYFNGSDTPGIYMVCIDESQRGKGYGKFLMNYTLSLIRKHGHSACVLQSTNLGINLYRKMEFVETGSYDLYIKIK